MTLYLLDTNTLSHLIRNPGGVVEARIALVGGHNFICTSIIVAAELRFGAEKKRASTLAEQVESLLRAIRICPLESPTDQRYGEIRASLEWAGQVISGNDMLIAAHALALNCVLVTDNVREFSRVPGLTVENWLR